MSWKQGDTAPFMRLAQEFGVDLGEVYLYAGYVHAQDRWRPFVRMALAEVENRIAARLGGCAADKTQDFIGRVDAITREFHDRQRFGASK